LHFLKWDFLNTFNFHFAARDQHTTTRGPRQPREQAYNTFDMKGKYLWERVWY